MRTKRINTDLYDSSELKNSSDGSLLDLSDAYDKHLYLKYNYLFSIFYRLNILDIYL